MLKLARHRPAKRKIHSAGLCGAIKHSSLRYACDWEHAPTCHFIERSWLQRCLWPIETQPLCLNKADLDHASTKKTHLYLLLNTQTLSLTAFVAIYCRCWIMFSTSCDFCGNYKKECSNWQASSIHFVDTKYYRYAIVTQFSVRSAFLRFVITSVWSHISRQTLTLAVRSYEHNHPVGAGLQNDNHQFERL